MTDAKQTTQAQTQTGALQLRIESQVVGNQPTHAVQTLVPGQVTKVKAQKGERYKVVRGASANPSSNSQPQEAALADEVVATRQGDDLQLRYAGDAKLVIEGFFPVCEAGQCAAIVPGADAGGMAISGASPTGIGSGSTAELVYAYGQSSELRTALQGMGLASSGAGFTESTGHLSYLPADQLGAALPWLSAVGAGVVLAIPKGSAVTLPTVLEGHVVAGPVVVNNGLHATAYRADGTVITTDTVDANGNFSLRITDGYTGPVLVRVYDTSAGGDYMDEATGQPKDLGSDLRAATVIPGSGTYSISVNMLTELAVRHLGLSGGDSGASATTLGNLTATQVNTANTTVAQAVGLTQDLVQGTAPVAVIDTQANVNAQANAYGKLLAALSGAEVGSSTDAVLQQLNQDLSNDATLSGDGLALLVHGASQVSSVNNGQLIQAVSDLTNKVSTTVISTVSVDNTISSTERGQGITVQGTAAANASVNVTWGSGTQVTGTHTVTADANGQWSASFISTEIPTSGATVITASNGSAVGTRSVYVEPNTSLATISSYDGTNTAPAQADFTAAGVTGVTSTNLGLINSTLASLGTSDTDSVTEVQAVADAASAVLSAAAGGSTPLTLTQLQALGITGVTTSNLAAVQAAIAATADDGSGADTLAELQALANSAAALSLISSYDGTNTTPALADFTAAGVTGVTTTNLGLINSTLASLGTSDSDSAAEVQAVADAASAVLSAAAGGSTPLTLTQLQALGITGVTTSNLAAVQAAIAATADDGSGVDTLAELQTLANLDYTPPTVSSITTNHTSLMAGQTATVSITLSEASTNFTVADLQAVGGTLSSFAGSGTSYTVTFTPDNNRTDPGSVTIASGVFTDAAGNASVAGSADGVVMAISTIRPTATLVARQTELGVGDVTTIDITLSEKSTDFTVADLTYSHGTLSDFTPQGDGIHYSVTFTPDANYTGTGGVTLADGAFTNAAGNINGGAANPAATDDLAIDTTPPTVTITSDVAALAIGKTATITFTFNKDPGDSFDAKDIAVNGGTLTNLTNHTGKVWTAHFTPTDGSSGQASITVAKAQYTDAAGNLGSAGTSPSLTIDTLGPVADLNPLNATTVLPGKALVLNFTEEVHVGTGNFVLVDDTAGTRTSVTLTSSMLSNSGKTLTITPANNFLVAGNQYHVEADPGSLLDAAGNAWAGIASTGMGNTAWSASGWHFTAATPSVSVNTIMGDNRVNGAENTAGVTISGTIESNTAGMVADFVAADFTVKFIDPSTSIVTVQASNYNTATGVWSLSLPTNSLTNGIYQLQVDVLGSSLSGSAHGATATTTTYLLVDLSAAAPTLALAKDTGVSNSDGITNNAHINVSGLEDYANWEYKIDNGSWQTGNGTALDATGTNGAHTVLVRQTDEAGNVSSDATLSFTLDTTADRPVINAVATDGIINASETGSAITGTAEAGATVQLALGSGKQARTVTVTADGSGNWTHTLNSGDLAALGTGQTQITAVQTDKAGNESFTTLKNLTVDTLAPTVTLSSNRDSLSAGQTADVTFSFSEDPGSSFTSADLTVTGGTLGAISGTGLTRTATFTPTANATGTASISVTAGSYTDAAGNSGQAANSLNFSADTVLPTVAITSSATTLGPGQVSTFTFTLSEASNNFDASSVTVVGGTLGELKANATRTVFTGVFTPDADFFGSGSVSVANGAFRDRSNNTNTDGSDTNNTVALTIQAAPTTLAITSDKTEFKAGETATITFDFSSAPTGFVAADVAVTGGTLSGLAVSNTDPTVYTATFTPTANAAEGTGSVTVLKGSYTGQGGLSGGGAKLTNLSFDTLAPTLVTLNPEDGGYLAASAGVKLVATFSEAVVAGSGNLRLVDGSTNTTHTYAIDGAEVAISGDTLTLTPTVALVAGRNYSISIDATALADSAGNAYVGIANATTWNFAATNLSTTIDPVTGDNRINIAEQSASDANNLIVITGKISSANSDVLTALVASDITVTLTVPRDGGWNDSSNKIIHTAETYDSATGIWTATVPKNWVYDGFSSNSTVNTFVNGETDTVKVVVTGRSGTAAAGLSVTLTDTLVVDLSAPATPTLTLAGDTGTSTSDEITSNGLINVGALEAGATWQYSTDNGGTWQTGAGNSFAMVYDATTTLKVRQSDAAGNQSSERNLAVTLDTQASAPVINAVATDNAINASETTSAITGTAEAGASVSLVIGANTRTVTANSSGVWSYTLVAADITAMGQGAEVLSATQTDKAGNTSAVSTALIQVDTAAPTATLTSSSASLLAGQSATVTVTLSEAVPNFLSNSLTVSGGTLGELTADASGLVYTGTFTPTDASTTAGSIQLASGALSDAAGNTNSSASNALAITVNTVRPTVAITSSVASGATLHAGDTTALTFTLSAASTDFADTDVQVKGGTLTHWTAVSGTSYTATFTPDANSTAPASVSVASGVFSNAAGNANADGADTNNAVSFAVATARPTVVISSDVGTLAGGQTASITFTFSEDPGTSFAWDGSTGDITVSGGTLSAISGSGLARSATFTPTAGFEGAASITVADASYTNSAGSTGQAGATPALTIDAVAPTVAISRSGSGTLGTGQTDTITFDFSEAPGESFTLADVDVSGGTLGALSAVSATRYVATFTPTSNAVGSARIGIASSRFADAAGNANADGADTNNLLTIDYNTGGTAPAAITLSLAADTGTSSSDSITNNGLVNVDGLAPGVAWEYTLDASAATPVWVSGTGTSFALTTGSYAAQAVQVRQGGNSGALVNAVDYRPSYSGTLSMALSVDTGSSNTDTITGQGAPVVSGMAATDTWRYSLDNGLIWFTGTPGTTMLNVNNISTAGLDQTIFAKVEATDIAGNVATANYNFRYDRKIPAQPNVSIASQGGGAIVAATNIEAGAVVTYKLSNSSGVVSEGTTYTAPTAPGNYTLVVIQKDVAGNPSQGTSLTFTIAAPSTSIELSAMAAGTGGFVINGQCSEDYSGYSVSSAGDVNGDGLADLIVGAYYSNPAAGVMAGRSYVVFGKTTGAGIDLSAVAAGTGGFVMNGQCEGDFSGWSVSSAGDVNGDGLADLIIGANYSDPATVEDAGRSYVVFGKSTGTPINLSAVAAGTGGFVINGQWVWDQSGVSVSSAGDVNGDGLADLIVAAKNSSTAGGISAGRSFVVFGKSTGTGINLSAVALGSGGFVINGQCGNDYSGVSVSSAGDVNGDGLADLIIGANYSAPAAVTDAGRSYVVFGKTTGTGINLSAVAAGSGGFVINGQCESDQSGWSVSSAGDVNGDGLADLIVGAKFSDPAGRDAAGRSYVVFGKSTGTAINLSAVAAGSGGFVINGQCGNDLSGFSVSSAGDFNGDGLADLIVGAVGANYMTGRSYVVFGKSTGTGINLSAVAAGNGGFVINGQCMFDYSSSSVSGAGDVNGDGLADLIVGANQSDPAAGASAGRSYVIFGSTTGVAGTGTLVDWLGTPGDDTQVDGGTAQTLVAGAGNDTLTATAASVLMGGAGNDSFSINQTMATALQSAFGAGGNVAQLARIDGGSGSDTLVLAANTALDLTKVAGTAAGDPEGTDRVASIERVDLSATGSSLTLNATDVAQMAGMNSFNSGNGWSGLAASVARHQLVIKGAAGTLNLQGSWIYGGTTTDGTGATFKVYNGERNTQVLLGDGRSLPVLPMALSAIADGVGGFVINGQCAYDYSGYSVSSAGDVNGDGLTDLIVGAYGSDPRAGAYAGCSYVVFGRTAGTAINLSAVAATGSTLGFVINGQCESDNSGYSVSSAGDVNGDGLADLIVGARYSNPATGSGAGRSYVVFGRTAGAAINLSALGSFGFVINGQGQYDESGYSVSSAGDVNGDGLADLIVGARYSNPATGSGAGRSYVVFGKTAGTGSVNLSAVAAGTGGFVINGQCADDYSGASVSSAGDVNGDGLADLIVGAYKSDPAAGTGAGRSYVVFGKTTGTGVSLSAVAATGSTLGFVINGQCADDSSGCSVSSAGDVNGDGLADLIVGASSSDPAGGTGAGRSYVVFGKTAGTGVDLSAVAAGSGGFVINGQCRYDQSGVSVSSAGDINGDGLADLIVGAWASSPAGGSSAGRSYVVFGKTSGTGIDLSAVAAGSGGFVINGQCGIDFSGRSVSSAGDVNGDGLADLIVGAYYSDPTAGADAGRSYVIFGSTSDTFMPNTAAQMGTTGNDSLSDNGIAQLLVGGGGNDTFTATAASVLRGGSGSDTFVINQTMVTALQTAYGQTGNNGAFNASIEGGHGGINSVNTGLTASYQIDRLQLSGSSITLDLTQVSNIGHMDPELNSRLSGIEVINLGAATNSLKLTAKDVLDLSDAVDLVAVTGKTDYRQLVVQGTAGATVDLADGTDIAGWTKGDPVAGANWGDNGNYTAYWSNTSKAMVLVQSGLFVV